MTRSRPRTAMPLVGVIALLTALVALLVVTFLPLPYVIQRPGPVFNTLGEVQTEDDGKVPLISVEGAETYTTGGALDLTTVEVLGNREHRPTWVELLGAWLDPSRAVVPIDAIFPEGVTTEQRDEQNQLMMTDSQHEATAAALAELGYDVPTSVEVASVIGDGASVGVLEQDDRIVAVDGAPLKDADALRAAIKAGQGAPLTLTIERAGAEQDVTITPREQKDADGQAGWYIGVMLYHEYEFPIDVALQIENVGGPSAGMMFALGIIDVLTPGELNGGKNVAGTGTITADGTVGAIGGIRQKLYGARSAGAEYFLAPAANCGEVVGHVPDGLRVFSTSTLEESLGALEAIADGGDLDALPTCTTAAANTGG